MKIRKLFIILVLSIIILASLFAILLFSGIIWRSPPLYTVKSHWEFSVPVIDMNAYDSLSGHPRPFIYQLQSTKGGSVYVLGIDHTKDRKDPQIDSIKRIFSHFGADIAFVEGRLGFLFSGLQNPVKVYGEGGELYALSKESDIPCFSWEPSREDEVQILLKHFNPQKVALFYALRPYLSNYRFGIPDDPDKVLQDYIDSRTDYDGIRGYIVSVAQVDSIWQADFPKLSDWRDTSDEYGWPDGYLSGIFNETNLLRDYHMCSAIMDNVRQGKKVIITMGSSHAFRIKETLTQAIQEL